MKALTLFKEDPDRAFRLLQEVDPEILGRWEETRRKRPYAGIAGNDAHQNVRILGVQFDPYARSFGLVATHILAEELGEDAILDALRKGRTYVEFSDGERVPAGSGVDAPRSMK